MKQSAPSQPSGTRAIALVGPTAAGKTALSLRLAKRLGAEIISIDSRQVYRGMDIGTAKVSSDARGGIPHHGIDLVEPGERYSAGRFASDARQWVREIRERGNVPLFVGGTGFFLAAVMKPMFAEPHMDSDRRSLLREYLVNQPKERLERWVARVDPTRLAVAREGGIHRLTRTTEVAILTGRPLSWWHEHRPAEDEGVPVFTVVLELATEELDRRIKARVSAMMAEGLVEEVENLLDRGVPLDAPGMTGVGYREIATALEGGCTLEEAVDAMVRATRKYARRQRTWFRNQLPEAGVLRVDATRDPETLVHEIASAWSTPLRSKEPGTQ